TLLLNYLGKAHAVIAEHAGYASHHTETVLCLESDEVLILGILHFLHRQLLITGTADSSAAARLNIPGRVEHISHHGAGRGKLARASAVKHGILHRVPLHKHRIVGV